MAQTVTTNIPAKITAGDTITWQRALADYPASAGWVLKYCLINAAGKINIVSAAAGDDHLVSVAASVSTGYAAGDYDWQEFVEKAATSERYTISTGRITVAPNITAMPAGYDARSTARKTLDLIDAAMLAQGNNAWTQEYEIAGRRMKFRSVGEFLQFRSKLQQEVKAEERADRIARGEATGSKLLVRF